MSNPTVLFVCTGNTFRSYTAHQLFRENYGGEYDVISAGINPHGDDSPRRRVLERIASDGADAHIEGAGKALNREHVAKADYAAAMAEPHQEYIASEYDVNTALFNEVIGREGGIPDVEEVDADMQTHVDRVVDYIDEHIHAFHDNIDDAEVKLPDSYTRFLDLLSGGTHRDGTAYQEIAGTENAVAFHSIDIPNGDHDHVLVIPKERYVYYHNIPRDVAQEMTVLAQCIGDALMARNDGYNVLLNNEHTAGQCVYHAHIHLVGRFEDDDFDMEGWEHDHTTSDAYDERSQAITDAINPDHF